MKKELLLVMLFSMLSSFGLELTLDGKLDEAVWQSAPKYNDFLPHSSFPDSKSIKEKTEFRILHDEDNIYLGIYCGESQMAKIKKENAKFPWGDDLVELFFSPGCRQDEFYQFAISAGNKRWCQYYAEGGNIRPDPGYAPLWESKVFLGKDYWSVEARFPLAGFYHTRTSLWRTTWLFNVARTRTVDGVQEATWSPLAGNNLASHLFRKLDNMPMKKEADDLFIENVTAEISSREGENYRGELTLDIYSPKDCQRNLSIAGTNHSITLKSRKNRIKLPYQFKNAGGREELSFIFDNGNCVGRIYPVLVLYEPLKITLKTPAYSNAFYPGQDKSKVEGFLTLKGNEPAMLTFSGNGIKTQTKKMKKSGPFKFKSAGIGNEGAVLTATAGKNQTSIKISVPAPTGHTMCWIENGYLVINGKPVFVRMIEGISKPGSIYYGTGEKFSRLFDSERSTFGINNDLIVRNAFMMHYMIKGIEKEMTLDKEPNPELLKKIKEKIEADRNKDFVYYFLIDEPECRNISPIYLKHLYDYIKSLDLLHPVMICSRTPEQFTECADYITTHPYWGPYFDSTGKRLHGLPMYTIPNFFKGWMAPNKASALVPQQFSYRNLWNRLADYPTFQEYESSVWAAISCGATGIEAYHCHDLGDRAVLYDGARYIMTSLERLDSFLLTPDKKRLNSPDKTCAALFGANGEKLLILVNLSEMPVKMEAASCKGMYAFRSNGTFNGSITLPPYETALFTSKKMDDNLETRQALLERIANKEKTRLSSKNIFLEKGFDITLSANMYNNAGREEWTHSKLFDGTDTMEAWQAPAWSKPWLELGFPKFIPEFKRLVLHGTQLEKVTVLYWKEGEWKKLEEISEKRLSEYKAEYFCQELVRTIKLRFEYPQHSGKGYELYEVEAFMDGATPSAASLKAAAKAELPADNVLWSQTGKNIVLKANKGWNPEILKIFGNEEGQLVIRCDKPYGNDKSPKTDTYFPVKDEYPWLMFKLAKGSFVRNGYHGWCVTGPSIGLHGQDYSPISGIYAYNLNECKKAGGKPSWLAVYAYNTELIFDEISVVKKMDCMMSCQLGSDGINVTAELLNPAEDVAVRIWHKAKAITAPFHLKPANESKTLWQGTLKFSQPLKNGTKLAFASGELVLQADILGGAISLPVFSIIYQPYDPVNGRKLADFAK